MLISNHTCNTCSNARGCKLASANDYPSMMSKPKRPCDVIGKCNKWEPITRTVRLDHVARMGKRG